MKRTKHQTAENVLAIACVVMLIKGSVYCRQVRMAAAKGLVERK